MTEKIKIRQICFALIAFSTVGKFLVMPAMTAKIARESYWISALINLAVDGLYIALFLHFNEKFNGKTFYEIIELNMGKAAAKSIYVLYAIYFFARAYLPLIEQKNYIEVSLYQTVSGMPIFLMFFLVSTFFTYKGVKAVGRCADLSVGITIFAYVVLIALSLPSADFSELLPVIGVPATDVLKGSLFSSVWYMDSAYLLFMLGHFKKEDKYKRKIFISFAIVAVMVIFLLLVVYGEFGAITERQFFVTIRMGKYSVALTNIGRIDYIANLAFALSCVFATAIPLAFCSACISNVVGFKRRLTPAISVNVAMAALILFTENVYFYTFSFMQRIGVWYFLAMAYVLPLIALFFKKGKSKSK